MYFRSLNTRLTLPLKTVGVYIAANEAREVCQNVTQLTGVRMSRQGQSSQKSTVTCAHPLRAQKDKIRNINNTSMNWFTWPLKLLLSFDRRFVFIFFFFFVPNQFLINSSWQYSGTPFKIRSPMGEKNSKYIKCQKVHSNKPISGAGSPNCSPGSVHAIKLVRKIWNGKLILTARRWRSNQKNKTENIYI